MILHFLDIRYGTIGRLNYFLLSAILPFILFIPVITLSPSVTGETDVLIIFIMVLVAYQLLLSVKRLRDIGINVYYSVIGLALSLPGLCMTLMMQSPEHAMTFVDFMEKNPTTIITVSTILNLISLAYGIVLLFFKGKNHS